MIFLNTIFGKSSNGDSTATATEAKPALPDLSEVKTLIADTTAAINENRSVIVKRLDKLDTRLTSELQALEDREERRELHKGLKDDYVRYHEKVLSAITWMDENITIFHGFVSYNDNRRIADYLGKSGRADTTLQAKCTALRDTVTALEAYITSSMPPTQEILDLYVLAVNWLLVYDKTILTLRSYLAHSLLTIDEDLHTQDYLDARAEYSLELDQAISDAQIRGDFLVKTIDLIRFKRLDQIWGAWEEDIAEDPPRKVWLFLDKYPTYGVGVAKSDLTRWHSKQKCLIVHRYGAKDDKEIEGEIAALRQAYKGLQASCVRASTSTHREHALSWQISADRWRRSKPLRPTAGKSPVEITFVATKEDGKKDAEERGLSPQDALDGKGYEVGDRIRYAVSYVTNHGEGQRSEFGVQWSKKHQPQYEEFVVPGGYANAFFCLKLHPVDFNISPNEDLGKKDDAKRADEDQSAHIVRRLYVQKISSAGKDVKRHVIDVYAPPHKAVFVWDLNGLTSLPAPKHVSKLETSPDRNIPYSKDLFSAD